MSRHASVGRHRGRLLYKYLQPLVGLVAGALLTSSGLDMWFSYKENRATLAQIQAEKALTAAARIEQFVDDITRQVGWTTRAQWSSSVLEQRRLEYLQLLRQSPAITEVSHLDEEGFEDLKVSRVAMDAIGSRADFSNTPQFLEAKARKIWFSQVYFLKESEPYMTIAIAGQGRDRGVTVAEVNLKFIWDVISRITVGKAGYAYVVDGRGFLIAHPDIGLVLRKTELDTLPQVAAALESDQQDNVDGLVGRDLGGGEVLTANAAVTPVGWRVFIDLPISEAFAPLYASLQRTAGLMLLGLLLAVVAGFFLARRILEPVRLLQVGAARLGAGDLVHRIDVRTNDELETLAESFNAMADRLRESYASLERKVEERTRELSESLDHQTAISDVLGVISRSPTEPQRVLDSILRTSAQLCRADAAYIARPDDSGSWRIVIGYGGTSECDDHAVMRYIVDNPYTLAGRVIAAQSTVQMVVSPGEQGLDHGEVSVLEGCRTRLGVPLLRDGSLIGILALGRVGAAAFDSKQVKLVETFADQAVIAIENARLLQELKAQTEALAQSVAELQVLGEAGQAVVSTLNLGTVLDSLMPRAVEVARADAGIVFRYGRVSGEFSLWRSAGLAPEVAKAVGALRLPGAETHMGQAVAGRRTLTIPDLAEAPKFPLRDLALQAGYHAVLIVPLVRADRIFGAMTILYRSPYGIPARASDLMQTFASQSILAIQNARLFREIEEKGRQLELASQHKSQFLANMSHELRTPLNAILGYAELLFDGIYGDLSQRQRDVLERVQSNGRHLLGLINDVLDLSKIEAGQFSLAIDDYALPDIVKQVVAATEPLAAAKGLSLTANFVNGMQIGRGDERRIAQVLLNLVGNAIKFTDAGKVEVRAAQDGSEFSLEVADTGPGVDPEDQERIFDEFQQVDNTSTRRKGGTGLGLAISRRIVELHGGRISVESTPGQGATFRVRLPVRVERQGVA